LIPPGAGGQHERVAGLESGRHAIQIRGGAEAVFGGEERRSGEGDGKEAGKAAGKRHGEVDPCRQGGGTTSRKRAGGDGAPQIES
jgi:hypothetical protein